MKQKGISRTQLMSLFWAGVLAPAAQLLPGILLPLTGKGSWLTVLLAAPLVLLGGWLLSRLGGELGLAQGLRSTLGCLLGKAILLLYIVWAQLLLTVRLQACAQRLLDSGSRDGALWFFLLGVAGVLAWMGRGSLGAFGRTGQVFLAALLAASTVVLGLSVFQARPERIWPVWWENPADPILGALSAAGVLGWGLFGAFLLGEVRDQGEQKGWHWLFWGLGGTALLAAAQAVILGNLGAGLAMELDNPFFALAKSVGVEGAFQRVESIIAALWTFADLAMGGILVFAIRAITKELLPTQELHWLPWVSVGLAAAGGLMAIPQLSAHGWVVQKMIPTGNLILGIAVPGICCLLNMRGSGRA